jgi:hypothetical protein
VASRLASSGASARPEAMEPAADKAREVAELLDEPEPELASAEGEPTAADPETAPSEPGGPGEPDAAPPEELAVVASAPMPEPHPVPLVAPHALPVVELPSAPPRHDEPAAPEAVASEAAELGESEQPIQRQVQLVLSSRWQHPGLCATSTQAGRARELMMGRFRITSWDDDARLFLDPRLMLSTRSTLVKQLEAAEGEVSTQLGITPPRPDVFAYRDTKLLLAGSCANADVVAYYDGAVHVVPSQEDVAQSVIHEYTHHALTSVGVVAPAWAHEGIAMLVARETWWRQPEWLERVAERPFALEDMESAVPYTLESEQATQFYVQAAAMVACAIRDEPGGLKTMIRDLAAGARGGQLSYELPPLANPRFFRSCTRELLG